MERNCCANEHRWERVLSLRRARATGAVISLFVRPASPSLRPGPWSREAAARRGCQKAGRCGALSNCSPLRGHALTAPSTAAPSR
jgi:hypothetical protein